MANEQLTLKELYAQEKDNVKAKDVFVFPEGETEVELDKLKIEKVEVKQKDGTKRDTWVLHCGEEPVERKFWCGWRVRSGLLVAFEGKKDDKGNVLNTWKFARITRQGLTQQNTTYTVSGFNK